MKREEEEVNPFSNLQKSNVLQESKSYFSATPIDVRQCCDVLTQMLYLLHQGETLQGEEATSLFFGVSKLLQSKDSALRRLIYLCIKELAEDETVRENSFIVISSLEQDINGKVDLFRANAMRVLSKILQGNDASWIEQRQRYMGQAIVSRDPMVQSSALMSGIRLFSKAQQVISRWINKVQEAVKSENDKVSFHALQLLHMIKRDDRKAVAKELFALAQRPPLSPFAMCLLIRYILKFLNRESNYHDKMVKFLHRALNNKSNMVVLEAAKAICSLENATEKMVEPAIEALTDMLNSHMAVERFAAIRVMYGVVDRFPMLVHSRSDVELESLISDTQRNIAVLGITTMIKTRSEQTVDNLCKQIDNFMVHISDDLKVVLVEAIKSLCIKFPRKYDSLMSFLSRALREEGGFEYKKHVVDSILILMERIPAAQALGLEHLCEFIEDCEFPKLTVRILHVLGDVGPKNQDHKCVRFIFNRVLLELPEVRAVAVNALFKFGEGVESVRDDVITLLERCLMDEDDIVRDRAVQAITTLRAQVEPKKEKKLNMLDLEYTLTKYLGAGNFDKCMADVTIEKAPREESRSKKEEVKEDNIFAPQKDEEEEKNKVSSLEEVTSILEECEDFVEYGDLFKSSKSMSLTEEEGEYQVSVIKHLYENHIIFHFICSNTFDDLTLCDVSVELECNGDDIFEPGVTIPCAMMKKDEYKHIFVSYEFESEELMSVLSEGAIEFSAILKFTVKETTDDEELEYEEGYEDEYELNNVEIEMKDFVKGIDKISHKQFKEAFLVLSKENQIKKKFTLSLPTIQAASAAVVEKLGLAGVEFSDNVAEDVKTAMVNLAGWHISGAKLYARVGFKANEDRNGRKRVVMQIGVTSDDAELPPALLQAIR